MAKKPVAVKKAPRGKDVEGKVIVRPDTAHYVRGEAKTVGGRPTIDIGDETAAELRGLDIDEVYAHVEKELRKLNEEPEGGIKNRFQHLNVGMQRMNLGNMLRAARKRASGETPPKKKAAAAVAAKPKPKVKKAPKTAKAA